jgi:hypothetical protein
VQPEIGSQLSKIQAAEMKTLKLTPALIVGGVVLILVGACATTHESYAPDGRKAYALNCSGKARGWDKCFAAAGNICGAKGYDVLDRNSEDSSGGAVGGGNGTFGGGWGKTNERSMLIACKS